jgi:hypothetical protein
MQRIFVLLLALASVVPAQAAKKAYTYIRIGNAADVTTVTSRGVVLMGGGTDVDAAFEWMCSLSGNGDFLVIRAAGTDAYNPYVQGLCPNGNSIATLAHAFATVPELLGVIGDTHFTARDRMGRDLAFLCRIVTNGWSSSPRSIAVDEETALLVDGRGGSSVVGYGNVYFIKAPRPAEVCQPSTPLTYRNVGVYRIDATGSFDRGRWSGKNGSAYEVSAEAGALSSTQAGGSPY